MVGLRKYQILLYFRKELIMNQIRTSLRFLLLAVLMASTVAAQGATTLAADLANPHSASTLLRFTSSGHALGFSSQGVYAATGKHVLTTNFLGANQAQPKADSFTSPTGNTAVVKVKAASLGQVSYTNLWDGINLSYSAEPGSIYSTTYHLAPGADADRIRLHYNAPLTIDRNGALIIGFEGGSLTESAPIAWQQINGQHIPVAVAYTLNDNEVGFSLGLYDRRQPLTIDPTLTWNTFLGGDAEFDDASSIAVDANGNVYVTGDSSASWGSPVRAYSPGPDGFPDDGWVAKLNATDGSLLWNTFLGGDGNDLGRGIVVDGSGNIYVVGRSDANWGNPIQPYTPSGDAFAAKLDTSGNLLWNTFVGHNSSGSGIAVDGSGNVYLAGSACTSLPWLCASVDAFAAKLDNSGALLWNTFLGGSGHHYGYSIAVDGSGNVFITGRSSVTWGSPARAFTNNTDGFVAKLDSSGVLLWNTFLGGAGTDDEAPGVTVDGSGNVYVVGYSTVSWGSPIRAYTLSEYDTYAAKLDATDGNLIWNTFLGGSGIDIGTSVALDKSGNVFITGRSDAGWGSPVRPYTHTGIDGFIVKLNSSGHLQRNDFLDVSNIYDAALDGSGSAYVTGISTETWGNPVRPYTSGNDGFVAKLDLGVPTTASLHPNTNSTQDGWILESSEISHTGSILNADATTIRLGDDVAKKQYRAILSFGTGAGLPDYATITSVTLKLKQQAIVGGGNPLAIFKGLMVDIKNGIFGTMALQASDFQAAASKSYGPFQPVLTGGWYSINLTAARGSINTLATSSGLTQIRLRFSLDDNDNAVANYLSLYSSNAPAASRPQLVITYYVP
jgi:hypothetical protein